ncbi:hypothetical protein H310_04498 [Aphanomyces invadans]|uniref:Uncharacterized protein n=1 Tax=Aphanomyces invadans TaxID=157072 RepID=A0A024UE16_9STRA|nr:hypothetical protein H310_04498 [Aphanomyces invadans]ETW04142.1 hypothetical protein H310_04498 [Aphanomyces invadans]|eukprot:XP_008867098.1 hypothetical protein H310_04498 [Aphanomyces invadans]
MLKHLHPKTRMLAKDSVRWNVLSMVLRYCNVGSTFRSWIRIFYTNTLIYILLNDKPLDPFELGTGLH